MIYCGAFLRLRIVRGSPLGGNAVLLLVLFCHFVPVLGGDILDSVLFFIVLWSLLDCSTPSELNRTSYIQLR